MSSAPYGCPELLGHDVAREASSSVERSPAVMRSCALVNRTASSRGDSSGRFSAVDNQKAFLSFRKRYDCVRFHSLVRTAVMVASQYSWRSRSKRCCVSLKAVTRLRMLARSISSQVS